MLMSNKFSKVIGFILIAPAMAQAEEFAQITEALRAAKEVVQSVIANSIWLLAFFPIVIGGVLAFLVKEHLENKESTSQYEPRVMKFGKIIGAFVAGVIFVFILYGFIGKGLMGYDFGQSWDLFVTKFWKEAAGMAR